MKKLINRLDVSDVRPKLTNAELRRRLIAFVIGAFAMLACVVYAYKNFYLPYTWRSQVSQSLREIKNLDQNYFLVGLDKTFKNIEISREKDPISEFLLKLKQQKEFKI